MTRWKIFIIGFLIGLFAATVAFYLIGQRYQVKSSGPAGLMMIKLDTWTGRSWMGRYYEKDGNKIWYWEPLEQRETK